MVRFDRTLAWNHANPYWQVSIVDAKPILSRRPPQLDCYRNFVAGWVTEVAVKQYENKCLVIGRVSGNVAS